MAITLLNEDCMEVMKRYPDNHFDLADELPLGECLDRLE